MNEQMNSSDNKKRKLEYFSPTSWYNGSVTLQMIDKLEPCGFIVETINKVQVNPENPAAYVHVRASRIDAYYFYFDCPFCFYYQKKASSKRVEHSHGSLSKFEHRPELRVPHCSNQTNNWPANAGYFIIWITPRTKKDYPTDEETEEEDEDDEDEDEVELSLEV
jgi:hypothetical protein